MIKGRLSRGSSFAVVMVTCVILGLIGIFVVLTIKLLAGGEQMQRAADSGNLTLARAELDKFQVPIPDTGVKLQFNGASDHTGGGNGIVDMRNINAVLGQSLLVNFNAYQISQEGIDYCATSHATQVSQAANDLAHSLSVTMGEPSKVFKLSQAVSQKNSTKLFGADEAESAGKPTFSYVDRGNPSNVYIEPQQLPDYDFTKNSSELYTTRIKNWTGPVSGATDKGKNQYLLGYLSGITPGGAFPDTYFVPLRPGARPHLVSKAVFDANQKPSSGAGSFYWATPVPDAVSQSIEKQASTTPATAGAYGQFASYGQIQPIDPKGIPLAIKHGFIRIMNGAPGPVAGFAGGNNQDVFVFTENNPQRYAKEKSGKPLPYFVGVNASHLPYNATTAEEYMNKLDKAGAHKDCSGFHVGYALAGDKLGQGGVSEANCSKVDGFSPDVITNVTLSKNDSGPNSQLQMYGTSDSLKYFARPLIEAAYKLRPSQGTGSNAGSYSVGDTINLALLSARAQGQDFEIKGGQFNSGIADIPANRGAQAAPDFKIAKQPEAINLATTHQGIKKNGKIWNFLQQRCYQIDPTWTSYCPKNLDSLFEETPIPIGSRAYIYYSAKGNGGKGGLVMKEENAALADAPWLVQFISETPDAKAPTSPTEIVLFPLVAEKGTKDKPPQGMIDVDGDWGYPHPYNTPPNLAILDWFSFTPSSGYNNLLGEVRMGAVNAPGGTNCPSTTVSYTIRAGAGAAGSDTITLPTGTCDSVEKGTGPG